MSLKTQIAICIGFILILVFSSVQIDAQMSRMGFPELVACSCDSAYRCLSDHDYMQLVSFYAQEPDTFAPFVANHVEYLIE